MRLLLSALLLALIHASSAADAAGFTFLQSPGPHAVGFRVVNQYDESRRFRSVAGESARPIQTLVWYPARSATGMSVVYGDYVGLNATETVFDKPPQPVGSGGWLIEGMKPGLADRMWAARDAVPEEGRFPVVIYAASFSAPSWENADLCEYLASHGYLVIASPGMGVSRPSSRDVVGIEAQAADISFLINYASTLPYADLEHVAVVGYSWGGLSNVIAAARDTRIDALVALDGSLRFYPGLIQQASGVKPESMTLPLLAFRAPAPFERFDEIAGIYPVAKGPNVLNAWRHGDLITVDMLGMAHQQFNTVLQRSEQFWQSQFREVQVADYDRHDGIVGYAWVARYTRAFLDAYLKADASEKQFLARKPAENGVPAHVMGVRIRKAQPLPATPHDGSRKE